MITVYAIYENDLKEIYVGMTNNIDRRLSEHKRGQSRYTKKFKSFILIHTETFEDYKEGRIREKYLKSGKGKELLKSKL